MFSFLFKSRKRRKLEKEGLATSKTRLKQEQTLGHAFNKSKLVSFLILITVWFFCAIVLILPSESNDYDFYLVKDQQAPKTIHSEFSFIYLDRQETDRRSKIAREDTPFIYEIDNSICDKNLSNAEKIFEEIAKNSNEAAKILEEKFNIPNSALAPLSMIADNSHKISQLREELSSTLYKGIINPDDINPEIRQEKLYIIDDKKHLRESQSFNSVLNPQKAAEYFSESVAQNYSPQNREVLEKAIYNLAIQFITPNLTYAEDLTATAQKDAENSPLNEVYKEVHKGELIIKKGQKVTSPILEKFQAYEKELHKLKIYTNFWGNLSYSILMSLVIIVIISAYFYKLHPQLLLSNQKIGLLAAVIIISLIGIFIADKSFYLFATEYNLPITLKSCLLPLGLTSILLSVLVGLRAATFASLLVALIAAFKLESYFVVMLGMTISCFTGFVVYKSKNYKEFFLKAVFSLSIAFIIIELLGQSKLLLQTPSLIPWIASLSIVNGIITAIISLTILFMLESLFQINTDMSLLSLCDYNHPLLKQLQIEAPGTFQHCLFVATLAEQAADTIGANQIKARVCALFHDIGKISKPEYFTENNFDSENRHILLKPGLSSKIIINHVKEGANLALKHKLGNIIHDAIQQHHGTDLVTFFYRRAKEETDLKTKDVLEKEYRYPGPKPIEKEVVLVSLADSCEAASRSIHKPTPTKIETLVWEIIRKKIRDGELDNADITIKELALTRNSFVKTLNSMLHTRINYPVEEGDDNEGDLFQAAKEFNKNNKKRIPPVNEKNNGTVKNENI